MFENRLGVIAVLALVVSLLPGLSRAQDPGWFSDVTDDTGLTGMKGAYLVAVDLDNDDYPDLITHMSTATNRNNISLFLNRQRSGSTDPKERVFVDFTAESGVNANPDPQEDGRQSNAVSPADVDNDGDVDLVTCVYYHRIENTSDYTPEDRCEVLLNDGNAVFEIKEANGLHELGLVNSAGFALLDYDKDGNVDLFIPMFFKDYTQEIWGTDYLMRGNGDGTFTDVSEASGIAGIEAPLYGANAVDINNDGWTDILTSPYCRTRGSVWKNNGDGTFTDIAAQVGYDAHTLGGDNGQPLCQWGAMPADYDNDGDMDLFLNLVHGGNDSNEGRSTIVNNVSALGGFKLEWDLDKITWDDPQASHRAEYNARWFDMDNDTRLDLVVPQCCYSEGYDRLFMLHQTITGRFSDVSAELGMTGDGTLASTPAVTVMDYDLDGDEDVLVVMSLADHQLKLLRNEIGHTKNFLQVKLVGCEGVNRSAIGARVTVTSGDLVLTREVFSGEGHRATQAPFILNFGLTNRSRVDSVRVRWPGIGFEDTVVDNPDLNQLLVIEATPPQPDAGVDAGEDAGEEDGQDAGADEPAADPGPAGDGGTGNDTDQSGDDGCSCVSTGSIGTVGFLPFLLVFLLVRRRSHYRP
jgi:enediyne biosynthesis protein E4